MKKREGFFLLAAIAIIIIQHFYYLSELYYDRDVAGYAYNSLCILEGNGWYYNIWDSKPPGINFIIMIAFSLFGASIKSIYFAALFFNILSLFFIYLFARFILSKVTKFYFLLPILFSLFFASEAFKTYSANSEVFLAAFEIGGILFLGLNRYFISGLLLGLGFLVRQTGIYTFFAGVLFVILANFLDKKQPKVFLKEVSMFTAAFISPFVLFSIYFFSLGVFDKFIEYTFVYNLRHLSEYLINIRKKDLFLTQVLIWRNLNFEIIVFGLLFLSGLFYAIIRRNKVTLLIMLWFIAVCFGVLISAIYPHHFIQLIAPAAFISVLGITAVLKGIKILFKNVYLRNIFISVFVVILIIPYVRLLTPFITRKRPAYYAYAAKERFLAAQYIKEHTAPLDKIFVWDNFDSGAIYLWSKRRRIGKVFLRADFLPPGLIEYWVPFVEDYRFNQKQLLLEFQKDHPKYIVVVPDYRVVIDSSGKIKVEQKGLLIEKNAFPEFFQMLGKNYRLEKEISRRLPALQIYRDKNEKN